MKASGKWKQTYFQDKAKAEETYRILLKRMKAAESGFDVVPTWMSVEQTRQAEYAYLALEKAGLLECKTEDSAQEFGKAIAWLCSLSHCPTLWRLFLGVQRGKWGFKNLAGP